MLRKVQYAPEGQEVAPSVEITKDFVMSDKPLHVQATLDKEVGSSFTHSSVKYQELAVRSTV